MTAMTAGRGPSWRRWTLLFGTGLLGIGSLVPQTLDVLRQTGQVPEASPLYWTTSPTSPARWSASIARSMIEVEDCTIKARAMRRSA